MRWLRPVLSILASILLLLVLAVVILINTDLGRFKTEIEAVASDFLGRELSVGTLSVRLGKSLDIVAEDARLASVDWTDTPDLLTVEHLRISLDSWSLVSRVVFIQNLQAQGIEGHLTVRANGDANWNLAVFESTPETNPPSTGDPTEDSGFSILLNRIHLTNLMLNYRSEKASHSFSSSSIDLEENDSGTLEYKIDGTLNGKENGKENGTDVIVTGSAGPFTNIVDGSNVDIDLTGSVGEIEIKGTLHLDDLVEPLTPKMNLTVTGPNAEYLTSVLNIDPITTGPLDLVLAIGPGDSDMAANIKGTYGEFKIDFQGSFLDLAHLENLNFALHANGPSLATIAELAGQNNFPALPFQVDAKAKLSNDSLSVERLSIVAGPANIEATAHLPHFPTIVGAQIGMEAKGPDFGQFNRLLGLPGRLTGPFKINVTLDALANEQGAMDVTLDTAALQAHITGTIAPEADLSGSLIHVEASGDDLSVLLTALEIQPSPVETFSAQADLKFSAQGIDVTNGVATLGRDKVDITGRVGRDPMSDQTHLHLESTFENLGKTLAGFDLNSAELPNGTLQVSADLARGDNEFQLQKLDATLGSTHLQLSGRIGDSLSLSDTQMDVTVDGQSLATLLPSASQYVQDGPFSLSTSVSFSDQDRVQLADVDARFGGASAKGHLSLDLSSPLSDIRTIIDASGPSLSDIVPAAAEFLPDSNAFSIKGGGNWHKDSVQLDHTTVRIGKGELKLDGALVMPPALAARAMKVTVDLTSLRSLQFLTELSLPELALSLQATIDGTDELIRLSELSVVLGPNKLTGAASFSPALTEGAIPSFTAQIDADYLDLTPFQTELASAETASATTPSTTRQGGDKLIPDTELPIEWMHRVNGSVDVSAKQLLLPDAELKDVQLSGTLKDAHLHINKFHLSGDRGTLSGDVEVSPSSTGVEAGVDLTLNVNGSDLTLFLPATTAEEVNMLPPYSITLQIQASGSTIDGIAGSSTGYLRLISGEGKLNVPSMAILGNDFATEVVDAVNPFVKNEPYSQVQCIAVLVEATDGVVVGDPALIVQTDKLDIAGVATIDLNTEKVHAKFHTQAREGLGISIGDLAAHFTAIGGTMANPELQLDTVGVLVDGGTAVATLGISFLAKQLRDSVFADPHPCKTAVSLVDKDLANRQ